MENVTSNYDLLYGKSFFRGGTLGLMNMFASLLPKAKTIKKYEKYISGSGRMILKY